MEKATANSTPDELVIKEKQQKILQASIQLAVEMESLFKLYAYRIINAETYATETEQNILNYQKIIS